MENHNYETPTSITEALEMLANKLSIFVDTNDAFSILTQSPGKSYKLHWNSPVQGRVVIIPQLAVDSGR
ncbi:hypothetical protein GCM10027516_29210 [Niabella aquatica]